VSRAQGDDATAFLEACAEVVEAAAARRQVEQAKQAADERVLVAEGRALELARRITRDGLLTDAAAVRAAWTLAIENAGAEEA
jgi:hypothetical protein